MTLRAGIIGCGDIFPYHRTAWNRADGAHLVGFHDSDPAALELAAATTKRAEPYERLDALLEACDIVAIATPPGSHLEIGAAALSCGCHVLLEKPVVGTISEWNELKQRAKDSNLKIGAFHNQKLFGVFQRARKWIEQGRIGQVVQVHSQFSSIAE